MKKLPTLWLLPTLLLALVAVALLATPPEPAAAQGTRFVSNVRQNDGASVALTNEHFAQRFRTGSHAGGYTLNSADIEFSHLNDHPDFTRLMVRVRSDNASNEPGDLIGDLSGRPIFRTTTSDTLFTFRASTGQGILLKHNTDYWLTLEWTGGELDATSVRTTAADAEDSGGATGWNIADDSYSLSSGSWSLRSGNESLKMRLNGQTLPRSNGAVPVRPDWDLVPDGLGAGAQFRLMFITSGQRDATSTTIADYNAFVQGEAAKGHLAIQRYAPQFKVVGSTSSTDARDNTNTNPNSDTSSHIYWLDGAKLADNLNDFYDGSWDSYARRDQKGRDSNALDAATGSNTDGTKHSSLPLGATNVGLGIPLQGNNPISDGQQNKGTNARFYAMSPLFVVKEPLLVSNLGKADGASPSLANDHANRFQTGNSGYHVDSVDVQFAQMGDGNAFSNNEITVAIYSNNNSNLPGTLVATLTNPSDQTFSSNRTLTFNAPDGGVKLVRNTNYWLVVDVTGTLSGTNQLRATTDNPEDLAHVEGWSIDHNRRHRPSGGGSWSTTGSQSLKFAINGRPNWSLPPETRPAPKPRVAPPGRFNLNSLNNSSAPGFVFRVCPDGSTCDPDAPDSNTTWVVTRSPHLVLREGADPVSYQFKFHWPNPDGGTVQVTQDKDIFRTVLNWFDNDHDRIGCVSASPSTANGDAIKRYSLTPKTLGAYENPPYSHATLQAGIATGANVHNDPNRVAGALVFSDMRGGCPFSHWMAFPASEHNQWKTITMAAGHDPDAFDHHFVIKHNVNRGALGRIAGTNDAPDIRVSILDDDAWDRHIEVQRLGGGAWTSISEGGLRKALQGRTLLRGQTYSLNFRLTGGLPPGRTQNYKVRTPTPGVELDSATGGQDKGKKGVEVQFANRTNNNGPEIYQHTIQMLITGRTKSGAEVTLSHRAGLLYGRTDWDLPSGWGASPSEAVTTLGTDAFRSFSREDFNQTVNVGNPVSGTEAPPPEVRIIASNSATEGIPIGFQLIADPAPPSGQTLDVSVTVTATGDYGVTTGARTVTIGSSGVGNIDLPTTDDQVDEEDGTVTLTINDGAGYTVASLGGSITETVYDDDEPGSPATVLPNITISGGSGITEGGTASFTIEANPAADSPITVNMGVSQNGDWGATGATTVSVSGASTTYTITTSDDQVDEADGSVTATVKSGDGYTVGSASSATVAVVDDDDPPPDPEPPLEKYADLISTIKNDYIQDHDDDDAHPRWKRVLKAFGEPDYVDYPKDAMTSQEARQLYDDNGWARWEHIGDALEYNENYQPAGTTDPEITISGGNGITEGGTASFTISANPAPASAITVNVGVSQQGDFGATGASTVSVSGASTTYTITTTGDEVDEADGSVTATVKTGDGYTVGSASSASVNVADDDVPEITISGGAGITEGGTASFTISASPAPASAITVNIGVSENGSWGATGMATVTVSGASTTYTITTGDDQVDEADGSVTATVQSGTGYTVGSASSATVNVADDDDPPPDPEPPLEKYADLISTIKNDYIQDHNDDNAHPRWKRVLKAFGEADYVDYPRPAMTSEQAQKLYDDNGWARWEHIGDALEYTEDYHAN
ncbi:MAG: hypothetical protein F4X66_07585 [Chloroflexi bacterium]|nr:hypothetical protein [Chloroflexota bacterium]